jgi:hypothetical protein
MNEYAVDVAFDYYDTIFVKADSEDEARDKIMNEFQFSEKYKVLAHGKEVDFDNIEFMAVGEVHNV